MLCMIPKKYYPILVYINFILKNLQMVFIYLIFDFNMKFIFNIHIFDTYIYICMLYKKSVIFYFDKILVKGIYFPVIVYFIQNSDKH